MLRDAGWSEGVFLVRDKGGPGVSLVLSLVHQSAALHLLLEQKPGSSFTINGEAFGEVADFITVC